MKRLDFINKRLREKNEAGHTSTTLMKQCLSTIEYLQKKALATWAWIIRFLSSIRDTKKRWTIICYSWYRHWNICPIQVPWTGGKAIKELHKITSMSKKDIKSWLAKQVLWQVHIPPPKRIHHPHYDVTNPNEQHQLDLFYMPHNLFEGNTYNYI